MFGGDISNQASSNLITILANLDLIVQILPDPTRFQVNVQGSFRDIFMSRNLYISHGHTYIDLISDKLPVTFLQTVQVSFTLSKEIRDYKSTNWIPFGQHFNETITIQGIINTVAEKNDAVEYLMK